MTIEIAMLSGTHLNHASNGFEQFDDKLKSDEKIACWCNLFKLVQFICKLVYKAFSIRLEVSRVNWKS